MTTPYMTAYDVAGHLIRQRGTTGDPYFVAACLIEERRRRIRSEIGGAESSFAQLGSYVAACVESLAESACLAAKHLPSLANAVQREPLQSDFALVADSDSAGAA